MIQNWQQNIPVRLRLSLWILLSAVGGILLWATLTTVSASVTMHGRLEGIGKPTELKSPVKGHVAALWTQAGDTVESGEIVLLLDGLGLDKEDTRLRLRSKQLEVALIENRQSSDPSAEERIRLERDRSQLAQMVHLSRIAVSNPVRGRLLQAAHQGQAVEPDQTVAIIEPNNQVPIFKAYVALSDNPQLKVGNRVEIVWEGALKQSMSTTPGQVSSLKINNETMTVEIIPQLDRQENLTLKPGLRGEIHISTRPKRVFKLFWEWLQGKATTQIVDPPLIDTFRWKV